MQAEVRPEREGPLNTVRISRRRFLQVGGAGLVGAALLGGGGGIGCSVFGGQDDDQGNGGGNSKTLNINWGADIPDLNSTTTTDQVSFIILNNINEGLYRLDENLEPQPAMAESSEISDDELQYTFTLRDGVTWSNGDPITSQDFRYAWLRAMNPDTAGQYAFIIADYIEGGADFSAGDADADSVAIETPDDRTLEVTLVNPTSYFLGLTAFATYYPLKQSFVEEQGDQFGLSADSILYNGPYELTQLESASRAVLQKRDDYWDADNVDIERVDGRIVKDSQTALNLYQSGELDRTGLTAQQVDQNRDSDEFSTYTVFTTWWIQMNFENPVMSNRKIRQAIQRGFDPEALAQEVLNNGSEAATGFVPPGMAGPGDQTFREFAGEVAPGFDPGEARRLYEEGVQEIGEDPGSLRLELVGGDTSTGEDISTFLQSQLQESLGADVEIRSLPFDERLDVQREGDFQFVTSGWGADYNDPSTFMDLYTSDNSFNDISFSNNRYDELVNGARGEADEQARMQMFREAERILVEDEAAIALAYFDGSALLTKPYLRNSFTFPYGADYSFKLWSLEDK